MNLRTKLVSALAALLAVGLLAFGIGTYNRYSSAEYRRLDDRLSSSVLSAERELHQAAGLDAGPGPSEQDRGPDESRALGIGSYAQLRDPNGAVVSHLPTDTSSPAPSLPTTIESLGKPFTVASAVGSGDWRALATGDSRFDGYTVIVANPLGDLGESLRGLVIIETIAAAVILALMTAGAWLILRRGLRPLESMALAAGSIHEGDMSVRVAPGDGRGEVGQLGLALNSMLDNLQVAFDAQKESEAKLRQFLADASHELRTPLTSIQGFAELFRLGVANEMSEVDLAVLAADACSDAVAAAPDRRVTLDAPQSVIVEGAQDHLRQAIANLVANALTHTPGGTPIEVSARAVSRRAELIVRDHGEGLSSEALQHAFDRFWRIDSSRVGPKAGLGLSIVAAIAESHGGTATARNHPDGGAVFTLDLPLAMAVPESARPTEA